MSWWDWVPGGGVTSFVDMPGGEPMPQWDQPEPTTGLDPWRQQLYDESMYEPPSLAQWTPETYTLPSTKEPVPQSLREAQWGMPPPITEPVMSLPQAQGYVEWIGQQYGFTPEFMDAIRLSIRPYASPSLPAEWDLEPALGYYGAPSDVPGRVGVWSGTPTQAPHIMLHELSHANWFQRMTPEQQAAFSAAFSRLQEEENPRYAEASQNARWMAATAAQGDPWSASPWEQHADIISRMAGNTLDVPPYMAPFYDPYISLSLRQSPLPYRSATHEPVLPDESAETRLLLDWSNEYRKDMPYRRGGATGSWEQQLRHQATRLPPPY